MGDSIQAAKAGILEIADIFVVNKTDRPGAQEAIRDLRSMLAMARYAEGEWRPPIVAMSAATGEGVDELVTRLDEALGVAGRVGGAGRQAARPGARGGVRDRGHRAAGPDGRAARRFPA